VGLFLPGVMHHGRLGTCRVCKHSHRRFCIDWGALLTLSESLLRIGSNKLQKVTNSMARGGHIGRDFLKILKAIAAELWMPERNINAYQSQNPAARVRMNLRSPRDVAETWEWM